MFNTSRRREILRRIRRRSFRFYFVLALIWSILYIVLLAWRVFGGSQDSLLATILLFPTGNEISWINVFSLCFTTNNLAELVIPIIQMIYSETDAVFEHWAERLINSHLPMFTRLFAIEGRAFS